MSRENVELVRRANEGYARGDLATVKAAFDPEIEWHVSRIRGFDDFDAVYVGPKGVRDFFRTWLDAWESISFDFEELIDADDKVVVILTQRMRGRKSGVEIEWKAYAQVWTVREAKLSRMEFFPTRAEALEAVGLAE
jgi:ketosteroid isomerase-like protein